MHHRLLNALSPGQHCYYTLSQTFYSLLEKQFLAVLTVPLFFLAMLFWLFSPKQSPIAHFIYYLSSSPPHTHALAAINWIMNEAPPISFTLPNVFLVVLTFPLCYFLLSSLKNNVHIPLIFYIFPPPPTSIPLQPSIYNTSKFSNNAGLIKKIC